MPNIKNIIDGHNKRLNNYEHEEQTKPCNCRDRANCPLEGECRTKSVVYQAKITSEGKTETYVGLTAGEFKTR